MSWRNLKAREIGLTDVDKKLLMMQKKAQVLLSQHFFFIATYNWA